MLVPARTTHHAAPAEARAGAPLTRAALAARAQAFAAKAAAGTPAVLAVFPGQEHGFALRGNATEPGVRKASAAAFDAGLAFLKMHLA